MAGGQRRSHRGLRRRRKRARGRQREESGGRGTHVAVSRLPRLPHARRPVRHEDQPAQVPRPPHVRRRAAGEAGEDGGRAGNERQVDEGVRLGRRGHGPAAQQVRHRPGVQRPAHNPLQDLLPRPRGQLEGAGNVPGGTGRRPRRFSPRPRARGRADGSAEGVPAARAGDETHAGGDWRREEGGHNGHPERAGEARGDFRPRARRRLLASLQAVGRKQPAADQLLPRALLQGPGH